MADYLLFEVLAVVENENNRIQLLRWDRTVMATVELEEVSGEATSLKGAGGCVVVSDGWRWADGGDSAGSKPQVSFVFKNDELCIANDAFCIKNDEFCKPQLLAVADRCACRPIFHIIKPQSALILSCFWAELSLPCLANSYNHRVLIIEIHLASPIDDTATGKVLWKFTGGGGGFVGWTPFEVPTCVCEPRPGLLAVTDRDNGRLVLLELPPARKPVSGAEVVSRAMGGFEAPVGCCALPGGGMGVADTGRGRVVVLPPWALE